jgi:hypothetical protein
MECGRNKHRGMTDIYQHCDAKQLHRYLAEFDFRYNNRVALKINNSQRANNILEEERWRRC